MWSSSINKIFIWIFPPIAVVTQQEILALLLMLSCQLSRQLLKNIKFNMKQKLQNKIKKNYILQHYKYKLILFIRILKRYTSYELY